MKIFDRRGVPSFRGNSGFLVGSSLRCGDGVKAQAPPSLRYGPAGDTGLAAAQSLRWGEGKLRPLVRESRACKTMNFTGKFWESSRLGL